MVVCRFFLENRCRHGENCRNEHPRGGGQRDLFGRENDNWQQNTFRNQGGQGANTPYKWVNTNQESHSSGQQVSALDHVNNLPKEMETWESSKMWPFSCLAVDKDMPSLPEFYDISVEEMRMDAYEALKLGNIQPYAQKFQSLVSEFQNKRQQFKNMSMETKQKLASFLQDIRSKNRDGAAGMSSSAASSTAFGSSQSSVGASTGLFGKPSNPNAFLSSGTSLFGNKPQTGTPSIFGGNQSQTQGFSTFGNQSQTFPSSSNPFQMGNSSGPPTSAPSLFGNQSGNSGSGLLGAYPGAPVNQQQPAGTFGSALTPTGQSLFGKPIPGAGQSPSTPSLFGKMAPESSSQSSVTFGSGVTSPSTNPFGSVSNFQPQGQTLFGKPVPPSQTPVGDMSQNSPSLLGVPSAGAILPGTNAATTAATEANPSRYTPISELNEAEKAEFLAPSFTLGKIPMRPPPREMINI